MIFSWDTVDWNSVVGWTLLLGALLLFCLNSFLRGRKLFLSTLLGLAVIFGAATLVEAHGAWHVLAEGTFDRVEYTHTDGQTSTGASYKSHETIVYLESGQTRVFSHPIGIPFPKGTHLRILQNGGLQRIEFFKDGKREILNAGEDSGGLDALLDVFGLIAFLIAIFGSVSENYRRAAELQWQVIDEGVYAGITYGFEKRERRSAGMANHSVHRYEVDETYIYFADGRTCVLKRFKASLTYTEGTHIRISQNGNGRYKIESINEPIERPT